MNREESLFKENQHTCLEEWIHWATKLNDTRLYWLWMRFVITASASSGCIGFSNVLPALNVMKPVTDVLSWGLFGGRLVMQLICVRQHILQKAGATPINVVLVSCLSDLT